MVMNDAPVLNPAMTGDCLPSSTTATSGLVRLAAPALRGKCISAVTNIHKRADFHLGESANSNYFRDI